MEFVNRTPLGAELSVRSLDNAPFRLGSLVVKATFALQNNGVPTIVTDDPFPIFHQDIATEFGYLPADQNIHQEPKLEVLILGQAYAPSGRPTTQSTVAVQIDKHRHQLAIFGNRYWILGSDGHYRISVPVPFDRIPLTLEHAFGGSCQIQLDEQSSMTISHPYNPKGKGWDIRDVDASYQKLLDLSPPYPQSNYQWMLPNIEDPENLIAKCEDNPFPMCWSPRPQYYSRIPTERIIENLEKGASESPNIDLFRAPEEWIIDVPAPGSEIIIEGMSLSSPLKTSFPNLQVEADYVMDDRKGCRTLDPVRLVILPEIQRMYIVYQILFSVPSPQGHERCFRLKYHQRTINHQS
jgi:hypothetical protein